mgnify:CR=1 FL=1
MTDPSAFPYETTRQVGGTCLCLYLQRAARAAARRFDEAFRPLGLTNGQFSLLMSLNRPEAPKMGHIAEFLALDRTTLTANLKPLQRRGLVTIEPDPDDRRSRRLKLTREGEELLAEAYPIWKATHAELDRLVDDPGRLRDELIRLL